MTVKDLGKQTLVIKQDNQPMTDCYTISMDHSPS